MKEIQVLEEAIKDIEKLYDSIDKTKWTKVELKSRALLSDDIVLPDEVGPLLDSLLDGTSVKYVIRKARKFGPEGDEYEKYISVIKKVYNDIRDINKFTENEIADAPSYIKEIWAVTKDKQMPDFDSLTDKKKAFVIVLIIKLLYKMQKEQKIEALEEIKESYKPATGDFVDILEKVEEGLSVKHRKYLKASGILTEKKIKDKRGFCQTVHVLYHNKVKDNNLVSNYKEFGKLAVNHYGQFVPDFSVCDAYWYASQWEYEHHKLNFTEYIKERRPARDISF